MVTDQLNAKFYSYGNEHYSRISIVDIIYSINN